MNTWDELQQQRSVSGGMSEPQYDLLDAQVGEASFNAEIARLQLEQLQNGNPGDLSEAGARIALRQRQLDQVLAGPSSSQITTAQIALQQAESRLRDAEVALNRMTLVAPMDGVVNAVNIEIGQPVRAGTPSSGTEGAGTGEIEISDIMPLGLTAQVDEVDIGLLTGT